MTRSRPTVAVVMPAYNEDRVGDFLREVDRHLGPVTHHVDLVVVDDGSTTPAEALVEAVRDAISAPVRVLRNEVNLGHGPTALRAYQAGLDTGADLVVHVDGDGQFLGSDMADLVTDLWSSTDDGVVGVRLDRSEPWFRVVLSAVARWMVGLAVGGVADPNTPLRIYRREAVLDLLTRVSPDSLVPHLHFTVLERRLGLRIQRRRVGHRPHAGDHGVGTTWPSTRMIHQHLPTAGLLRFAAAAAAELAPSLRRGDVQRHPLNTLRGPGPAARTLDR